MKGRLIGAAFIIATLAIFYFNLREILAIIFPIVVVLYMAKVMIDTYVKPFQIAASYSYEFPRAVCANLWLALAATVFCIYFRKLMLGAMPLDIRDDFTNLFFFALLLCMAEILVISSEMPFQVNPKACKPHGAWLAQITFLSFAAIFCMLLRRQEMLFVVIVCSLSDTGAFTAGKLFGKHKAKFSASISPNKTIEGYVGGIIFTLIAIPVALLLRIAITPGLIFYLFLGGLIAEIGDLLGSATKRQLSIKDSGDGLRDKFIFDGLEYPIRGHGGYLDRMDSISLNIILYATILGAPQL